MKNKDIKVKTTLVSFFYSTKKFDIFYEIKVIKLNKNKYT